MNISSTPDAMNAVWPNAMLSQHSGVCGRMAAGLWRAPPLPSFLLSSPQLEREGDIGSSHQLTAPKQVSRQPRCYFNSTPGHRGTCICSQNFSNCSVEMYYKSEFQCNWRNKRRETFFLENKLNQLFIRVFHWSNSRDLNSSFFSSFQGCKWVLKKRLWQICNNTQQYFWGNLPDGWLAFD